LPPGATERGRIPAEELDADACPHGFVYAPDLAADLLEHQVERETALVRVAFVTDGATQSQTLAYLESLRAALRADPTLGGQALSCYVAAASLREVPDQIARAELVCLVSATSED
ncbi:MAG: hypothetical protein ACREI7_14215, partial [Myxococcota bacterium]